MYLASLSDLQGAPVLIWPVPRPTTRSAMKQSSVSPDLRKIISLASVQKVWFDMSLPVGHHGAPALGLGHVVGLDGFGNASNLVDLEKEPVAGLLLDGGGDPLWVGDQEVISHDLNLCAGGQLGVSLPVILVKGILNTDNWVVLDEP